jgi:hypothetical protein
MTPDIWQNRRTAYHEAGHAVIGRLLGYKILSIEIFAKGGTVRGWTEVEPRHQPHQLVCIREAEAIIPDISRAMMVVMVLAGIEAELQLGPYEAVYRDYVGIRGRSGLPGDHVALTRLICGYHRDDIEIMLRPLNGACGTLVETHWPKIEALAEALLADGRIVERKEIRRILGRRPMPLRDTIFGIARRVAEARAVVPAQGARIEIVAK